MLRICIRQDDGSAHELVASAGKRNALSNFAVRKKYVEALQA